MAKFDVFFGIAVEDKALDSRKLRVFLRELTPFSGGALKNNARTETYNVKDEKGQDVSGNVKTTNNITADYFGMNSNSAFPPCVVAGEQVLVFKYEGEDKYYWISAGRDDNLRKTEIMRMAVSGDNSQNKTLSEDNTYFVELDSKVGKRIRMHTSKSNGEAFGYDLSIDATAGAITLGDDVGNKIIIDSNSNKLVLSNKEGSVIGLNGKDIIIMAAGNLVMRAGGTLFIDGPTIQGGDVKNANISDANISNPKVTGPDCSCC